MDSHNGDFARAYLYPQSGSSRQTIAPAVVPHPTRGDARRPLPSWGEANKEPGFFPFVRSGLRLVEANHFRRALNDTRTSGKEDEDGAES